MRWLLLLVLASNSQAQAPSQTESVIDVGGGQAGGLKDCGLITRFPGDIVNTNCLQQSTNLLSDRTGVPTRRLGYSLYNGTPCPGGQPIRGMWPFYADNGTSYSVMLSSNSMFYSPNDGTCNYISGLQGAITGTATMECVQSGAAAGGSTGAHLWCTDGIDQVFATNVVSTTAVTQAPTGYHIGTFRNRIVISGIPGTGANGSGSQFYLSGELNGLDYTIPGIQLSTSPAIISVNGINDGQTVTCLMGEFQNQFLIGRPYDLWGLSGYNLTDFALRKISSQVGCLEPRSVQEVTNVLYWLSHRGVEGFTGTQINRVSYPIDANILPIIASAGNAQTNSIGGTGFLNGNFTAAGAGAPTSGTIAPGSVVPSSFSFTGNSVATLSSGTLNNLSAASGSLSLSTYTFLYPALNMNFQTGDSTNWTFSASGSAQCGQGPGTTSTTPGSNGFSTSGSFSTVRCQGGCSPQTVNYSYQLNDGNGNPVSGPISLTNSNGNYVVPINLTGLTTNYVSLQLNASSVGSNQAKPINGLYLLSNSTMTLYYSVSSNGGSCTKPNLQWDVTVGNDIYFSTGSYFSPVFDTGFSTPVGGPFVVSSNVPTGDTITYQVRQSTSLTGTFSGWSAQTAGSQVTLTQEFWQLMSSFTTTNPGTSGPNFNTPTVSSLLLQAETTGYYITPCVLVSSPTSYGNFLVNGVTNGGAFTFWISTGATCGSVTATTATWNTQIPNSIITVSTGVAYLAARVLFSVDSATEVPTINNLTFTWNASPSRPPTCSAQWDDRYLLFYTTSTSAGAYNDHAFVYDQNQKWQLWDDQFVGSAILLNNLLYTGDSRATGSIYQQDIGQTDNGNAFTMTFQTADFDGGDPNMNKEFSRAYIMLGAPNNNNGTATLSCSYSLDGSTLTYSLAPVTLSQSPTSNGYFVAKLPFIASQPVVGHWLNMTCSYTGSVGPVAVHRIRLVYTNRGWD